MNQKTDNSGAGNKPAEQNLPGDTMPDANDVEPAEATVGTADRSLPGAAERGTEDRSVAAAAPRRRVSAAVAWFALLLAAAALALSGWLAWQVRESGAEAANNEAVIEALSGELDEALGSLSTRLDSAVAEVEQAATQRNRQDDQRIASLQRELDDLVQQAEAAAPRLGNLENAVSSLQGVSAGMRDAWMLAEAEYYLQIANAQLQLAGSPRIATLALNFADELIRQMSNPALGEVRLAVTRELQALQAMETVDLEGITLALASLAERVAALPLNETVKVPDDEQAPADPELTGWARAWASIKSAFGDVVSVRRTDEALTPLLSPDAVYFLRANLALKFQAARLALLKGEQAVFEQSLSEAASWLEEYYDTGNRAVRNALQTIADLKDGMVSADAPDISESLRLLRQYRSLRQSESSIGNAGNGGSDEPDR